MAELRLEELSAKTIVAARQPRPSSPGQEAFIAPETYAHAEQHARSRPARGRASCSTATRSSATSWATSTPNAPEEFLRAALWRINVAGEAQGAGVGRFAVQALADEARRAASTG